MGDKYITQFWRGNRKERKQQEDLEADGRKIDIREME
jgi:hypothetical protein